MKIGDTSSRDGLSAAGRHGARPARFRSARGPKQEPPSQYVYDASMPISRTGPDASSRAARGGCAEVQSADRLSVQLTKRSSSACPPDRGVSGPRRLPSTRSRLLQPRQQRLARQTSPRKSARLQRSQDVAERSARARAKSRLSGHRAHLFGQSRHASRESSPPIWPARA